MGNRSSFTSFDQLENRGRRIMLDGILTGQKFAQTIGDIVRLAAAFGGGEAERADHFPAKVVTTDFNELVENTVDDAINSLFYGETNLKMIVNRACLSGAAFGFAAVKKST